MHLFGDADWDEFFFHICAFLKSLEATAVKKIPRKIDHLGQLESPSIPVIIIVI